MDQYINMYLMTFNHQSTFDFLDFLRQTGTKNQKPKLISFSTQLNGLILTVFFILVYTLF